MSAIITQYINKIADQRARYQEITMQNKQEAYSKLLSILAYIQNIEDYFDELSEEKYEEYEEYEEKSARLTYLLVYIDITSNKETVSAIHQYINSFGESSATQHETFNTMIREIRYDLGIDKNLDFDFPSTGFYQIQFK